MTKSLGHIAYEAFHADPLVPAELVRHWYSHATHQHEAWQAAAEAVMHEVIHGVQWDYMPPQVRAVVEAARAAKDEIDYILKLADKIDVIYPQTSALFDAVKALEKEAK